VRKPYIGTVCPCHQVPLVKNGQKYRCAVKLKAAQKRYKATEKSLQNERRYDRRRRRRVIRIGDKFIRMPSREAAEAARALMARRRYEFEQRRAAVE
jgi:hypothetical protein